RSAGLRVSKLENADDQAPTPRTPARCTTRSTSVQDRARAPAATRRCLRFVEICARDERLKDADPTPETDCTGSPDRRRRQFPSLLAEGFRGTESSGGSRPMLCLPKQRCCGCAGGCVE